MKQDLGALTSLHSPTSPHAQGRRATCRALGLLAVSTLLLPAVLAAVPQTGGATISLDSDPKAARAAGPDFEAELKPACSLEAADLSHGCSAAAVRCGPPTELNCEQVEGGLNHLAAGTGLRNTGYGTIRLRGAPPGAQPVAAWLYWGVITAEQNDPQAGWIDLDGRTLQGERIGRIRSGLCWEGPTIHTAWQTSVTFAAYRTSVLSLLRPSINGDYAIDLGASSRTDGSSPWTFPVAPPPLAEGASLLVVYAHQDVPVKAHFYLHHGAQPLVDELDLTHQLHPPAALDNWARHTRIGADGQGHADGRATTPVTTYFHTPAGWLAIRGPGSDIDPNADWQGADGAPLQQLWDSQVTDFDPKLVNMSAGTQQYGIYYAAPMPEGALPGSTHVYDCVGVVAHALSIY